MHFKNLDNLRTVAVGCLRGLSLLCDAGVVHCDMKVGKSGIRMSWLVGNLLHMCDHSQSQSWLVSIEGFSPNKSD